MRTWRSVNTTKTRSRGRACRLTAGSVALRERDRVDSLVDYDLLEARPQKAPSLRILRKTFSQLKEVRWVEMNGRLGDLLGTRIPGENRWPIRLRWCERAR